MERSGSAASTASGRRRRAPDTFARMLARRFPRRALLRSGGAVLAAGALTRLSSQEADAGDESPSLTFTPVAGGAEDEIRVPDGYVWEPLARWGDRVKVTSSRFDPSNLDPEAQRRQVGYNCGFLAWVVYQPTLGGLLCIGHDDTCPELMFPDYSADRATLQQVDYELAALGVTVFQAPPRRGSEAPRFWLYTSSNYNERLHGESPLPITGPVAGHPLLMTSADPEGTVATGTFNACGGGLSPWGTFLIAEGRFGRYFANNGAVAHELAREANAALGVRAEGSDRPWWRFRNRFDLAHEPNEANKFGWIVELDPWDRAWPRRKITALGRLDHCSASASLSPEKKLVVYTADSSQFGCVYKYVSTDSFDRTNRPAARSLLDNGTLFAARFDEDGTGEWLPLLHESGPLNASSGFASQADVLLFAGRAAQTAGATRMENPADIQASPDGGKAYLSLRGTPEPEPEPEDENPATGEPAPTEGAETPTEADDAPAEPVSLGTIVEIVEEDGDGAGTGFSWQVFMQCGDPAVEGHGAYFAGFSEPSPSPIARPGQIRFGGSGSLTIATRGQHAALGIHDGVYFVPTEGEERGFNRQILSAVTGASCGPAVVTPDRRLMVVAIQHPGKGGTRGERTSSFGGEEVNRPAVVAVTRSEAPYAIGS